MTSKTMGSRPAPMRLLYTAVVSAIAFAVALIQVAPASAGSRKGVTIGIGAGVAAAIAIGALTSKKSKSKSASKSASSGKKSASKGRNANSQSRSFAAKKEGTGKSASSEKKGRYNEKVSRNSKGPSSSNASRQAATGKNQDLADDDVPAGASGESGESVPAHETSSIAAPSLAPGTPAQTQPPSTVAQLITTPSEITAAQEHLRYLGYDVTTISGVIDPATRSAVMKYQQSLGATVTGDMTVEQLQSLFKTAAQKQAGGT